MHSSQNFFIKRLREEGIKIEEIYSYNKFELLALFSRISLPLDIRNEIISNFLMQKNAYLTDKTTSSQNQSTILLESKKLSFVENDKSSHSNFWFIRSFKKSKKGLMIFLILIILMAVKNILFYVSQQYSIESELSSLISRISDESQYNARYVFQKNAVLQTQISTFLSNYLNYQYYFDTEYQNEVDVRQLVNVLNLNTEISSIVLSSTSNPIQYQIYIRQKNLKNYIYYQFNGTHCKKFSIITNKKIKPVSVYFKTCLNIDNYLQILFNSKINKWSNLVFLDIEQQYGRFFYFKKNFNNINNINVGINIALSRNSFEMMKSKLVFDGIMYVFEKNKTIFLGSSNINDKKLIQDIGKIKISNIENKNISFSYKAIKSEKCSDFTNLCTVDIDNFKINAKEFSDNFLDYVFVTVFNKNDYLQNIKVAEVYNLSLFSLSIICAFFVSYIIYKLLNIEFINIENNNYDTLGLISATHFDTDQIYNQYKEFFNLAIFHNIQITDKLLFNLNFSDFQLAKKYTVKNFSAIEKIFEKKIQRGRFKLLIRLIAFLTIMILVFNFVVFQIWYSLSQNSFDKGKTFLELQLVNLVSNHVETYSLYSKIISKEHSLILDFESDNEKTLFFETANTINLKPQFPIKGFFDVSFNLNKQLPPTYMFRGINRKYLKQTYFGTDLQLEVIYQTDYKDFSESNCLHSKYIYVLTRVEENCNFKLENKIWFKNFEKKFNELNCSQTKFNQCSQFSLRTDIYTETLTTQLITTFFEQIPSETIINANNTTSMLLGINIGIRDLNKFLEYIEYSLDKKNILKIAVIDDNFSIIGSSEFLEYDHVEIKESCKDTIKVQDSYYLKDLQIQDVSKFLALNTKGNLKNIQTPKKIVYKDMKFNPSIYLTTANNYWKTLIIINKNNYFRKFENLFVFVILLAIFTVVLISLFFGKTYKYQKKNIEKIKNRENYLNIYGQNDITEESLEALINRIKPEIFRAFNYTLNIRKEGKNYNSHLYQRAVFHIKHSFNGHNVLRECILNRKSVNRFLFFSYKLQSNFLYKTLLYISMFAHIILWHQFPQSLSLLKKNGINTQIYTLSGIFIFIELIDTIIRLLVLYKEIVSIYQIHFLNSLTNKKLVKRQMKQKVLEENRENFLSDPNILTIHIIKFFLLVLVFFDQIFIKILNQSLEYYFPLKPIIFILSSNSLRRTFSLFIRSLYQASDILIILFVILMVSSLNLHGLFYKNINTGTISSGFSNIIYTFITNFVFVTSAENYVEVVYPALYFRKYSILFLLFQLFTGMLYVMGMVTGYFQKEYTRMLKYDIKCNNLRSRIGILAAFSLLDKNENYCISVKKLMKFLYLLQKNKIDANIDYVINIISKRTKDKQKIIDIKTFLECMDQISLNFYNVSSRHSQFSNFKTFVFLRERIFENSQYNIIIGMILIGNMCSLSFYGIFNSLVIDYIGLGFLLFYTIEIITRLLVYNFFEYQFLTPFNNRKNNMYHILSNRCDLVLISLSQIIFLISKIILVDQSLKHYFFHLSIVLPILRIFTTIKRIRYIVFTLFQIFPLIKNLWVLLILLFYFYGFIGMSNFSEAYLVLSEGVPDSNFETLFNSIVTLFQLTIGEGWHNILYKSITVKGMIQTYYFFLFVIVVQLLYTNLFISLILSVFEIFVFQKEFKKEISALKLNLLIKDL